MSGWPARWLGYKISRMEQPLSVRDFARILAGAVTSLVMVSWLVVFALALLSFR